ncbi:hypothetical protein [Frigidibacter sp. MR17.24]|uniref:hypothetical protein n=1 Tax=Frigidibacter sp. MR17.24 TaxID=3127345 RepID=UPI0030130AA2
MPLQNRVRPEGEIVADPGRGLFMGNRGCLHDADRRLGAARWRHRAWICCRLAFRDRRRPLMAPGRYTELFFLDEAVALAAGHRPCAECRREDYSTFLDCWQRAFNNRPKAAAMDAALHRARLDGRTQRREILPAAALPDGCFLLWNGAPHLVLGDRIHRYGTAGYDAAFARPASTVTCLTPAPVRAVLAQGYRPVLHPTAG